MSALAEILTPPPKSGEPDWLAEARRQQAEHFRTHGIPHERLENWKYTSLRTLQSREFESGASESAVVEPEDLGDVSIPGEGWRAVFVDGLFSAQLSYLDGLPEGVQVGSLGDCDADTLERFRAMLTRDFDAPDESLAALAAAMGQDGLVVTVADGVRIDRSIHLLHVTTNPERPIVANVRNLIEVGEGASLQIFEHFAALGDTESLSNVVTQIRLNPNSELQQIRLQQAADPSCLVTRQEVEQAGNSKLRYMGFDLGGRLVRHDLSCRLVEPGARAELYGVYALEGKRLVDNHTRIDHEAPHTTSEEFFKGVLDGRSRGVFNGKVVVHPGADKTDAAQTNNNLVLSEHAEIDTKPELEIYADDVKCSHGATVGQLDERQLFYLRARGIPLDEARLLLTYAFCREIVDRVGDEELGAYLSERVVTRLPRREALKEVDE